MIFATDSEVTDREFQQREENRAFFEAADVLILDSQYTLEESFTKFDFGHTSYTMAVNLAVGMEGEERSSCSTTSPATTTARSSASVAARSGTGSSSGTKDLEIVTAQEGLELAL